MAGKEEEFVYRVSTAKEWQDLQKNGSTYGGELDTSSGFIHLSNLDQVLLRFFHSFVYLKPHLSAYGNSLV